MEDHLRTVYYNGWVVWEEQLLRLSYCLIFLTNFIPGWFFMTLCTGYDQ